MISLSSHIGYGLRWKSDKVLLGSFCIILSAVLFGGMPFLAKISYAYGGNAYMASFGRFFFGAFLAGIILICQKRPILLSSRQEWRQLFILSLLYAVTPLFLYESYWYMDSGLATTFHFAYPIIVMFLLWLFCHARFTVQRLVSATLCTMGIIFLCQTSSTLSLFGAMISLLSGLTYAIYIVLLGKSNFRSLPALTLTFWISSMAATELGIMALITGKFVWCLPWQAWAAEFCLGLFATVVALALFQRGVFLCGEVKASLLSTFEPVTSILIGCIVLDESMTWRIAFGILLILFAGALLVAPQRNFNDC